MSIPALTLRQSLNYDDEKGEIVWRERPVWHFSNDERWSAQEAQSRWNSRYAGRPAFNQKGKNGYLTGVIDGKRLLTHRTIIALRLGYWPKETVDHVNGVRTDNRLVNLRLASRVQQSRNTSSAHNSTSRFLGVSFRKERGHWRANIFVEGKQTFLGSFNNEEEAAKAYDDAARKHFGEFARCNFP